MITSERSDNFFLNMFHFKQFSIDDSCCAMKIGTDGVLLGAWTDVDGAKKVLDVGTGSGLIALMMAQKTVNAIITGIDIDEQAILQARDNVSRSIWKDRLSVMSCDFNNPIELKDQKFDLIVSNPPFFSEDIRSSDEKRDKARNTESLPISNLINNSDTLLDENGRLTLVMPPELATLIIGEAAMHSLFLTKRCDVYTKPDIPAKRTLLEFSRMIKQTERTSLSIYDNEGTYSSSFKQLTQDFYL